MPLFVNKTSRPRGLPLTTDAPIVPSPQDPRILSGGALVDTVQV